MAYSVFQTGRRALPSPRCLAAAFAAILCAAAWADGVSPRKTGDSKKMTLPGGAEIEFIWCEPGTFNMGSPADEVGRFNDEPLHKVELTRGFWLGRYEVTQEQYKSVTGKNPSRFKGARNPVDSVSWTDCRKFIDAVNEDAAFGGAARLPTEAEWEYACRAGTENPIAGNGHIVDMAWFDGNSAHATHKVGITMPNAWGFHDMHGNVLEWCQDWFSGDEADLKSVDPTGPATGSFKVVRGGCWFYYEADCRSAYRLKRDPELRNNIFGFRLALSDDGR